MSIELSPFRLGLLITEKCNIECKHCWFESGPQKEATMTPEEIRKYINEAHRTRSIKWISLTGGEPTLFPELVEKSIELATSYRLKTELVTNCYWAETEYKAIKWLRTLRELGLDTVNISSYDFHQDFI